MINPVYSVYARAIPASPRMLVQFDRKMEVLERKLSNRKSVWLVGVQTKVAVTKGDARKTVAKTHFGVSLSTPFEVKNVVALQTRPVIQMRSYTIQSA